MPTTRPRHAITESDDIARALAVASQRWPGESPSRLLSRLIETGAAQVERERGRSEADRRAAVERLTDLGAHYPDGYLEELREDWPS